MKKVSIIIVNWNGKQYLKDCLTSLYSQKYKEIEVIFVDNASSDGSVEYVKKQFPKAKIIRNKENLGFAEANNVGYSKATGEYVLFLNNDTKVTKDFLTNLVAGLESEKSLGAVQSKLLLMDDPTRLDSVGAFLTGTGFLYHYGIGKKDSPKYNKKIFVYSAKGACMLIKRSVLEKVKVNNEIFDSRYFAYFEETDLCHRIWLAGYKIMFIPNSVVYHKMGGTSTKLESPFVQFHSFKNRINSYIKNLSGMTLVKILVLHLFFCEVFAVMSLFQGRVKIFTSIHRAIFWNISNIVTTIKYRKDVQDNIRKIEDRKVFKNIYKHVPINYYYYLFVGLENYFD